MKKRWSRVCSVFLLAAFLLVSCGTENVAEEELSEHIVESSLSLPEESSPMEEEEAGERTVEFQEFSLWQRNVIIEQEAFENQELLRELQVDFRRYQKNYPLSAEDYCLTWVISADFYGDGREESIITVREDSEEWKASRGLYYVDSEGEYELINGDDQLCFEAALVYSEEIHLIYAGKRSSDREYKIIAMREEGPRILYEGNSQGIEIESPLIKTNGYTQGSGVWGSSLFWDIQEDIYREVEEELVLSMGLEDEAELGTGNELSGLDGEWEDSCRNLLYETLHGYSAMFPDVRVADVDFDGIPELIFGDYGMWGGRHHIYRVLGEDRGFIGSYWVPMGTDFYHYTDLGTGDAFFVMYGEGGHGFVSYKHTAFVDFRGGSLEIVEYHEETGYDGDHEPIGTDYSFTRKTSPQDEEAMNGSYYGALPYLEGEEYDLAYAQWVEKAWEIEPLEVPAESFYGYISWEEAVHLADKLAGAWEQIKGDMPLS